MLLCSPILISRRRTLVFVAASTLLVALVGCGRQESTDNAPRELRGEPIQRKTAAASTAQPETNVLVAQAEGGATSNATPVAATPTEATDAKGKYLVVGFPILSGYTFELPDDLLAMPLDASSSKSNAVSSQIPPPIQALDQQRVAIQGYMLPLKVSAGYVTEMLVMKDQSMCCYGTVPKINEWVSVKMIGDGVKPVMDEPITMVGTLHVGEMRENGYLVGIYSLDGERMQLELPR